MLFVLTGSSCSGKTTIAFPAAEQLRRIAVHDVDEVGVPGDADQLVLLDAGLGLDETHPEPSFVVVGMGRLGSRLLETLH
jgi:tRNA uridine 5-carbamoylmethylation protein Kti12